MSNIADTLIRNEIAAISICKPYKTGQDSLLKSTLEEIPLIRCSDSLAIFEKKDINSIDLLVAIRAGAKGETSPIKEVSIVFVKVMVILPERVVNDIAKPACCGKFKAEGRPISQPCKVYRSADTHRVYIYLLNEKSRQEVIWVVKDGKYFTRVINAMGGRAALVNEE